MWKSAAAFILAIGAGGFVAGSVLGDPGPPNVGDPVVLGQDGTATPSTAGPTAQPIDDDCLPDRDDDSDDRFDDDRFDDDRYDDDDLDTVYHEADDLDDDDCGRDDDDHGDRDDRRDHDDHGDHDDSSGHGSGHDDSGDDSGHDDD